MASAKKTKQYLTRAEKDSLRKSVFALQRKIAKDIEKLGPGSYDKTYLKEAQKEIKKAYQWLGYVL